MNDHVTHCFWLALKLENCLKNPFCYVTLVSQIRIILTDSPGIFHFGDDAYWMNLFPSFHASLYELLGVGVWGI